MKSIIVKCLPVFVSRSSRHPLGQRGRLCLPRHMPVVATSIRLSSQKDVHFWLAVLDLCFISGLFIAGRCTLALNRDPSDRRKVLAVASSAIGGRLDS
ncbi:hypothetical protein FA95DRAFT_656563 [Auriscalpium vulgare]|uniref:Uncharacterized protein n=1 Tax=Auriscalpium vulgare TaxID=40419 RepID=A0ACB8RDU3_9AGAM|nr:hypothetical protein FA95DRAFT_656563 [Auriscalpium vulgare]